MKQILTKTEAEVKLINSLPNDIKMLSNFFELAGFKLFLVGGAIRDTFLDKEPKDFDVCTNALPGTIVSILTLAKIKFDMVGAHFGVIIAKMDDNDIEIASFRTDTKSTDNRHPEVRLGVTMEDDCRRRDFTCNAMFMDLQEQEIIDLVGGIQDLTDGVVRCVGVAENRFDEDHLRKVRAVVRAVKDGFSIHHDTMMAIEKNPELNISSKRIVIELMKTTDFKTPSQTNHLLGLLFSTELVHVIFKDILINDLRDIAPAECINSFNTFLASIICVHETDVAKKLLKKNFTAKTANSVEFLLKSDKHASMSPMTFFTKRKSTDLTDEEISLFNGDTFAINWLINFKHDSSLSETLMAQGLSGKELGDMINKTHTGAFIEAIKQHDLNSL